LLRGGARIPPPPGRFPKRKATPHKMPGFDVGNRGRPANKGTSNDFISKRFGTRHSTQFPGRLVNRAALSSLLIAWNAHDKNLTKSKLKHYNQYQKGEYKELPSFTIGTPTEMISSDIFFLIW